MMHFLIVFFRLRKCVQRATFTAWWVRRKRRSFCSENRWGRFSYALHRNPLPFLCQVFLSSSFFSFLFPLSSSFLFLPVLSSPLFSFLLFLLALSLILPLSSSSPSPYSSYSSLPLYWILIAVRSAENLVTHTRIRWDVMTLTYQVQSGRKEKELSLFLFCYSQY